MDNISIGNEIKDGFERTDKWVKANLTWLSEIETFYRQRATIEKEYAEKMKQLTSAAFKKKAEETATLSVGEKPLVTPGSLESASIVAWNEVLTQTENMAKKRAQLGRDLETRVASEVRSVQERYERLRQRWKQANESLVKAKEKERADLMSKKKAYDEKCQSMENQRAKSEKNSSSKNAEKYKKKEKEMYISKNEYIMGLSVANRLKDKYYYQDVPEVLDGLQSVNEAKVSALNGLLLVESYLERQCNENCSRCLKDADSVIKQNIPRLDSAMFVKHNVGGWKEPADFQFEPSPIWHDDETMAVEGDAELEQLKERLGGASLRYERYEQTCTAEKQQVGEVLEERKQVLGGDIGRSVEVKKKDAYLEFEKLLFRSISMLEQFSKDDSERVRSEVEIETIQTATEGKDMTISQKVVQPKKSSRFGLFHHRKRNGAKDTAGNSGNGDSSMSASDLQSVTSSVSKLSLKGAGRTKSRLFGGKAIGRFLSSTGNESRNSSVSNLSSESAESGAGYAKAKFPYEAKDEDEVSIQAGETLSVLQMDDGSGWTQVHTPDGSSGLVPTTYIEIIPRRTSQTKKVGPQVAPRRHGKKIVYMQALYDYQARGSDELSIKAGDKIVVTSKDDGSGWTEGQLNGSTGLFPTSYAKSV
ncbi:hypothetical protein HII13_002498 [Brettanomyces bruxellensis]|nr:hypothetical protein HII13_002498 [Brettanomyces bruxellensis]